MDSEYVLTADGELVHAGIKGMRWGIRRYQNKDGSLTPAGRKRYNAEAEKLKEREKVIKNQERTRARLAKLDAKKAELDAREKALRDADEAETKVKAKAKEKGKGASKGGSDMQKKTIGDMTDEELFQAINRARMEDTYRQLRPEPISAGKKLVGKLRDDVIIPAAINGGKKLLENSLNKAAENILKTKVDPNSLDALRKTAEKLRLNKEIEKLTSDKETMSWDDKVKEQTARKMKRENDDAEAAAKKKNAAAEAEATARESERAASDRKRRQEYRNAWDAMSSNSSKRDAGDARRQNVDDAIDWENWSFGGNKKAADTPVSGLPALTTSRGKSSVDSHMNDTVFDLIGKDGETIRSFGWDDD